MLFVLVKFDVRVGNQVVWMSESVESSTLPGIEFKMMPSGLHDRQRETVYFVCGNWTGVARYERRANTSRPVNREDVKMYSLAALTPAAEGLPWNQESYLKMELSRFMDTGDLKGLPTRPFGRPDPRSHPILAASQLMMVYGPMVFELWKAGLLRSRIILPAIPGQSLRAMCQFTYLAAQLSSVPSDIAHLLPQDKQPVPCLYNVAISDLQRLQSAESFWATTTDGLLLAPSRDACDCYAEQLILHDNLSGPPHPTNGPTSRDRHRLKLLVDALGLENVPASGGLWESFIDSTANGMLWWASAGESSIFDREETAPLLNSPSTNSLSSHEYSSDGVSLIGQFQQYSRQFIRVFARLAQDDDSSIRIGIHDIAAMGLDPLAQSDRKFLQRFSQKWWDRPVVFTGVFCC